MKFKFSSQFLGRNDPLLGHKNPQRHPKPQTEGNFERVSVENVSAQQKDKLWTVLCWLDAITHRKIIIMISHLKNGVDINNFLLFFISAVCFNYDVFSNHSTDRINIYLLFICTSECENVLIKLGKFNSVDCICSCLLNLLTVLKYFD